MLASPPAMHPGVTTLQKLGHAARAGASKPAHDHWSVLYLASRREVVPCTWEVRTVITLLLCAFPNPTVLHLLRVDGLLTPEVGLSAVRVDFTRSLLFWGTRVCEFRDGSAV